MNICKQELSHEFLCVLSAAINAKPQELRNIIYDHTPINIRLNDIKRLWTTKGDLVIEVLNLHIKGYTTHFLPKKE